MRYYLLLLSVFIIIPGCIGYKPAARKSAKSAYETFYVGKAGTQYFIKPIEFQSEEGGIALVDITFRYKKDFQDTATVNISFYGDLPIKDVDSVWVSSGEKRVALYDVQSLFIEKRGDDVVSRFTSIAYMPQFEELFSNSEWKITLQEEGEQQHYLSGRKTSKLIVQLEENIFSIL